MATTYSWVISRLDCYPQQDGKSDVVFTIYWRRQAVDADGHFADCYGTQGVTLDPSAPFTPFPDLTNEIVEGWLAGAMGVERLSEIDAALDAVIANQINPPVITPPLPWSN